MEEPIKDEVLCKEVDEDVPFAPEVTKPTTKKALTDDVNRMFMMKPYFINGGVSAMMEVLTEATGGRTTSIGAFTKEELETLWEIVSKK